MKRDMDLVRAILLEIEKMPPNSETAELTIEGWENDAIQHHIGLLHQAGLVNAIDASAMGDETWIASSLTWNGHEFLEASRNLTLWNKAKALATEKGGVLTLEVLKAALVKVSLTQFGC